MEVKQVFISYKSEEFDEAYWVKTTLESNGISCWMAPMSITGGASYASEIPAAIDNCTVFVLILSEIVQQSKWVPRELDQAINANKVIMPFMLEDCQLKDEFKFYLSNIQRYYAYQDKAATMERMIREIKIHLGIPDAPAVSSAPEEPAAPEKPAEKPVLPVQPPKQKERKQPAKAKKRIAPLGIIGAIAAGFLLLILLLVIGSASAKITFAGTECNKDAYSLEVEGKTITADDMLALEKFEKLGSVRFKSCSFETEDLSAFSRHPLWCLALNSCNLTDTQLQSINFDALERLTDLNLNNNTALTDLGVLSPVADTLTTLYIDSIGITNLQAIESFGELKNLSIQHLELGTLESLCELVYLETLLADGNLLETLSGLENTTILKTVSLQDNKLTDVSVLANSAATLEFLYLDNNAISDLFALKDCTSMQEFSAAGNQLISMDWAANWSQLVRLSLADNKILSTAASAPQSTSLIYLDLSGNELTAFSGFIWDPDSYVTINLSNNRISLMALPANCKYKTLALHGNPLTNIAFLGEANGFSVTFDYFDALNTESLKSCEFFDIYIVDYPTNRKVELEQASTAVTLLKQEELSGVLSELDLAQP